VEVDLFERLPTPFGLIRAGVAPDLGIPGEELSGSHATADFVGWYNGHPDHADRSFELSSSRAVIVGNGNVALDVARVLLIGSDGLAETDAAEHALDALRQSAIEEVVILGRRGLHDAAFSVGEFLALGHLDGVDVETSFKLEVAREYAHRTPTPGSKRIVFRFNATPVEVMGVERAEGLRVDGGEVIDATLILRSIGYRGAPMPGLAYDEASGVIPNDHGRVLDRPPVRG
jgi:ferredoxin--NADP+ reductase